MAPIHHRTLFHLFSPRRAYLPALLSGVFMTTIKGLRHGDPDQGSGGQVVAVARFEPGGSHGKGKSDAGVTQ